YQPHHRQDTRPRSTAVTGCPRRRGDRMRRRMSAYVMFDTIDRIVNLDLGKRGVDKLYEPARARSGEALTAAAARSIAKLAAGDRVGLVTGSLTRPWVSMTIGETDGPVGTAALARALSYGFNAIPVVVTDSSLLEPSGATLRAAGLAVVTLEQARRATSNRR